MGERITISSDQFSRARKINARQQKEPSLKISAGTVDSARLLNLREEKRRHEKRELTPEMKLRIEKIDAEIDMIRMRKGEYIEQGTIPTKEDFKMRQTYLDIEKEKRKARERAVKAAEQLKQANERKSK